MWSLRKEAYVTPERWSIAGVMDEMKGSVRTWRPPPLQKSNLPNQKTAPRRPESEIAET